MKYTDLKCKEVVDCKDGKRLGFIVDLEIDPCDGRICEIILPLWKKGFDCFKKQKLLRIPFRNIIKIGPDIILVRLCEKK